jgi:hypothetical protein
MFHQAMGNEFYGVFGFASGSVRRGRVMTLSRPIIESGLRVTLVRAGIAWLDTGGSAAAGF